MIIQNHTANSIAFLRKKRSKFFAEHERRIGVQGLKGGLKVWNKPYGKRNIKG